MRSGLARFAPPVPYQAPTKRASLVWRASTANILLPGALITDAGTSISIGCNVPSDPRLYVSGGEQALGFEELGARYAQYRVLSSSVVFRIRTRAISGFGDDHNRSNFLLLTSDLGSVVPNATATGGYVQDWIDGNIVNPRLHSFTAREHVCPYDINQKTVKTDKDGCIVLKSAWSASKFFSPAWKKAFAAESLTLPTDGATGTTFPDTTPLGEAPAATPMCAYTLYCATSPADHYVGIAQGPYWHVDVEVVYNCEFSSPRPYIAEAVV